MTKTVERDRRSYQHRYAGLEPVFVADAGRSSSAWPCATGHALLVAWLDPIDPADPRLADVRIATGELRTVPAGAVCSAANLAAFRITAGTALLRRTA